MRTLVPVVLGAILLCPAQAVPAQEELPKDTEVIRTLTRHNRLQVGTAGRFPCAGVYAVVESSGTMQVGDRVELA